MTSEQVDRARRILEEQCLTSQDYAKQEYGRQNGEDFPDLVRAAMASKGFCDIVGTGTMMTMLIMAIIGPKSFTEKLQDKEHGMAAIAQDPLVNRTPLDVLWLGYQLGRQMEREEAEVLRQIAEK
jgi:hypothetical protein